MNRVEEIIDRVSALPPLPDTALRLMAMLNDPRSSVSDIVETIRYDQAITAEVLRLCNSAHFGLVRRITSLSEAMTCLGAVKVLQLVLSVHANGLLRREQRGYGLAEGMLWKNSVAVAIAASEIAPKMHCVNAGLVFTAGLLHDLGKVVMNEAVADAFREILRRVTDEHEAFCEAEQAVLGCSHAEVGAALAERWQLPEPIVQAIRYHHAPNSLATPDPVVDCVHLADCICLILGFGLGEDGLYYRADANVLTRHGLGEPDLERVAADTLVELQRLDWIFAGSPEPRQPACQEEPCHGTLGADC